MAALMMHKPGQGYWTRLMTLLGVLTIFGWGALWVAGQLTKLTPPFGWNSLFFQGAGGGLVLVIGAVAAYWLAYSKARTSEFLIATEGEMKKVNWSSRREVRGSTWVVIGLSVVLASALFVVDLAFSNFFQLIRVLERPS